MTILILIYGLIIGSFLNVCIYRIPRSESIVWPGSHCPGCYTGLRWYDNIPVLSYFLLKVNAGIVEEKISLQYPLVETLNAIVYIIMYYKFSFTIDFVFTPLIFSFNHYWFYRPKGNDYP